MIPQTLHLAVMHFAQAATPPSLTALPKPNTGNELKVALEIVFSIIGAISLLVIVLAGFTYITSQGDPGRVSQAKNAIIYASAGLAISILAVSIVGFTIGHL
jgi:hypothetical protein